MKNKKKKSKKIIYLIPIVISIIMVIGVIFCYINTKPISSKNDKVVIKIEEGSTIRDVSNILEKKGLIRNKTFLLVYIKLNNIDGIKAGDYLLNKNMSLKTMLAILQDGGNAKGESISITFNEGKTMRGMAKIIEKTTSNSYDDVFEVLADKDYIKSLINKYWFLDETIINENIYYPLEGYLSPNTYEFKIDVSVKEIFERLLDQTGMILEKNKNAIENSNFNIHQIITLASMVESEGVTLDDRKNIAGVFINRLNSNMSLGSDVTTYYAAKIELGERDLYKSELNSDNPYNTRSSANAGRLPVGPICNPSEEAIEAVINYTSNDYLYFVADKNMKVYFTKTDAEHNRIIKELKSSGLWFEY